MELHRIPLLLFQLIIVRLVSKSDAFALQFLQLFTVDLNACGGGDRHVVPEDVAHVVAQPCGRQYNRGRVLLSTVNAIHENFCVGMSAVVRFCEPLVSGVYILRDSFAHEVQFP